ncbi:hypothetical protein A2872_03395 [Candidatus Gottesmanbacteria bacterium RIFCSPHIGHO2_01_FULL_42_12]|uniref:Uncharacterized protein n=1 Tax=Candidatus Gottesmanbacteria bacterium RIFCSPHIGHO2_01_FULL_42_12 TaxID=1798377 RepID=A0A1F5Z4U1_9BACT|nr:MAG: hypothetical protein A2872_03395 [Candidatus Gottesmanbacteria bacterium RIFCSPHIGHO2_01_FULL_42_12]
MKKLLFIVAAVLIVIFIFVSWYTNKLPVSISKCGLENCHGLNLVCGSNIPDVCGMSYQLGDKCRKFANCQIVNGVCQSIKSPEFEKCQSCVNSCNRQYQNKPEEAFSCEAKC